MKKLFLILGLVILSIAAQAAPTWYKITSLSLKTPGSEWSEWVSTDLLMSFDPDTKHIEILTKTPQIFDYSGFILTPFDGGTSYKSIATDTNYVTVEIVFFLYDSGAAFIGITYNNLEYFYMVEMIE